MKDNKSYASTDILAKGTPTKAGQVLYMRLRPIAQQECPMRDMQDNIQVNKLEKCN